MLRHALILAILAMGHSAVPAAAQGVFVPPPPGIGSPASELTGKRGRVARELRLYGFDVDVSRMSNSRVALIDNALHGSGSESDKRLRVRSLLRRGFLQRAIDRF